MLTIRKTLTGMALTGALIGGSMSVAPAATAAPTEHGAQLRVTAETIADAIVEARAAGAVAGERSNTDGSTSVVVEGDGGVRMELSVADPKERLSSGNDSYGGRYVGFNAFDQNLIISGAMTAIAAAMCALGPAVCVVANVAAVLASTAIGSGGGVQCGTKSLRVYPISHKKPRCA